MKKSQAAVLIALGVLVITMIIFIVLGRVAVGSPGRTEKSYGSEIGGDTANTRSMDLRGFEGIVIDGAWTVELYQSDTYTVELYYPEVFEDLLKVTVIRGKLELDLHDWPRGSHGNLVAEIGMPSLNFLHVEGAADVRIDGFSERQMEIFIEGAAQVDSRDTETENLDLTVSGVGRVDLSDLRTVNAEVNLEGAGEIRLFMDGGRLDGVLEGIGTVRYEGSVREENIRVDGLGKVVAEN